MLPRRIRDMIKDTFLKLKRDGCEITTESLLIRNGHYCGHRFESGPLSAVWFCEEDQIKFHGKDGDLLMVMKPSTVGTAAAQRAA
ncbi:MAG: hypothetical protein P8N76_25410 [Pirellulaceae bacterium]|nr:hypothetical protein [Pirellulaceae bacterium]